MRGLLKSDGMRRREETADPVGAALFDRPATRPPDEIPDALFALHARRVMSVERVLVADRGLPINDAQCDRKMQVDQHSCQDGIAFVMYENFIRRCACINYLE